MELKQNATLMYGSVRNGVHIFSKGKHVRRSHLMRRTEIGEVNRVMFFATIGSTEQAMSWVEWHHVSPSRSSHATPRHLALLVTGLFNRTYTEFTSRLKRLPSRWYPWSEFPADVLADQGFYTSPLGINAAYAYLHRTRPTGYWTVCTWQALLSR